MNDENAHTEMHAVHSESLEKALLCEMFHSATSCQGVLAFGFTQEDFFDTRHKGIFAIMYENLTAGNRVNYVLTAEEVVRRHICGDAYMAEVMTSWDGTTCFWKQYCEELREYTIARRALKAGISISEAASDPGLVREIGDISRQFVESLGVMENTKQPAKWSDQVDAAYGALLTKDEQETFPFGILELDNALRGGAVRGELVIVAGDTGRGKSILLGMAAVEAAAKGHGVAFYSLEMPETEVILRMFAALMRQPMVPCTELQTEGDRRAAGEAAGILKESRISLRTDLSDIDDIVLDAEGKVVADKADVVVVDYLQLCHCKEGDNRSQTVAAISRKLRRLAARGCAVFAASQINDEGKVFESRAISHDANVIIGIGRGKHGPELSVIKNRRGRADVTVSVTLRGEVSRFE